MTEQELRAAVAEYDAELASELVTYWSSGDCEMYTRRSAVHWAVTRNFARLESGENLNFRIESSVVGNLAATMRAMDAAAAAFEASLKESGK